MRTLSLIFVPVVTGLVSLTSAPLRAETAAGDDASWKIPIENRWEYPQFVTFRPGNGRVAAVNPPRFSWPYVPGVVPDDPARVPLTTFRLQVAASPDMSGPVIDLEKLPFNFYNELAPLAEGKWYWRVCWELPEGLQWSEVRTFTIEPGTPEWDRTVFAGEIAKLQTMPHPRLGPADGDWAAYGEALKTNPATAAWFADLTRRAGNIIAKPWWQDGFVENDRKDPSLNHVKQREYGNTLTRMCHSVTLVAFMWKLTGDPRYAKARDYLLRVASWPRGGLTSPEYHGAMTKMPTQVTDYLAVGYDILYHDLTADERQQLLDAVSWRLQALFYEKGIWAVDGDMLFDDGLAMQVGSHPYQDFYWVLPAALLTAGDSQVADDLLPLLLNYTMGFTAGHGPDEGWSEGQGYAVEKPGTMFRAKLYIDLLMPGLDAGKNPQLSRFAEWFRMLLPLGIARVSFGDEWSTVDRARKGHLENMRMIAWLTNGEAEGAVQFYHALNEEQGNPMPGGFYSRPWVAVKAALEKGFPEPVEDSVVERDGLFPDGGWVMVNSQPLPDREAFQDAVGMIFQTRPTGGFSHSYPSDGSFVWYAYGETLSGGGGALLFNDMLARRSWSHNTVAVNGHGQTMVNPIAPYAPSIARLVAFEDRENLVWWAADLTEAYRGKLTDGVAGTSFFPQTLDESNKPEITSVLRFVVFVDRKWFIIYDDIQLTGEEEASFQWVYHIQQDVPLTVSDDESLMLDYTLGKVNARLAFAHSAGSLEVIGQTGRNVWVNPFTKEDTFLDTERLLTWRWNKNLALERDLADHSLWFNTTLPGNRGRFLVGLFAAREGEPLPELMPWEDGVTAELLLPDGTSRLITFGGEPDADISIDVEAVRAHAATAHPGKPALAAKPKKKVSKEASDDAAALSPLKPVLAFEAGYPSTLRAGHVRSTLALPAGGRLEYSDGRTWQMTDQAFAVTAPVDFIRPQGALVFDFMLTDIASTLKAGVDIADGYISGRLFTLPFLQAGFWAHRKDDGTSSSAGINFTVDTSEGEKNLQLALSRLEGNKPYQLVLNWDASADKLMGFLQGVEQSDMAHWRKERAPMEIEAGRSFSFGGYLTYEDRPVAPIAVASLAFYDRPLTPQQARALAGAAQVPPMAGEGRTVYDEPLDLSGYDFELIYENDFSEPVDWMHENDLLDGEGRRVKLPETEWVLEGEYATLAQDGDALTVRTAKPEDRKQGHMVLFNTRVFPDDILVDYTFSLQNDRKGLHIIFFNTHYPAGETIFDLDLPARKADFRKYIVEDINNYHISPWASDEGALRRTANMRKNSGFRLVAVGNDTIGGAGTGPHRIRLLKHDGTIRLEANGVQAIEYDDDGVSHGPVWDVPGNIGFRFMAHAGEATIDSLKVYRVMEKE